MEVETEVKMALLVTTDNIPIGQVKDMIVIMVLQEELIVVLQMIHMELVQIAPHLQNLREDVHMTNVNSNMINLSRV